MVKNKFIIAILLVSLMLSVLVGCQARNANVPTEPSASSQPTESTEPSSEATEPSSEATDPTETFYPRTIESLKSHMVPYITYSEACALFGRPDEVAGNTHDIRYPRWNLEDGYFVTTTFYPTINKTYSEYDATEPNKETNPDGTSVVWNLPIWYDHMEAYRAVLCKENPTGKGKAEIVEVWFDFPDPWYQGE